jgi:hypothetical protein
LSSKEALDVEVTGKTSSAARPVKPDSGVPFVSSEDLEWNDADPTVTTSRLIIRRVVEVPTPVSGLLLPCCTWSYPMTDDSDRSADKATSSPSAYSAIDGYEADVPELDMWAK